MYSQQNAVIYLLSLQGSVLTLDGVLKSFRTVTYPSDFWLT